MPIKYSENVKKAVRRIPPMYRPTVERALTETADDCIRITADSCVMAAMLTLIEDFGFGTDEKSSTRLAKFVCGLQERIDGAADKFDDAMREGLRIKLEKHGVHYTD